MSHTNLSVIVALGAKQYIIINEKVKEKYSEIRNELQIFSFRTEIEKEAFIRGLEVGIEHDYYKIVTDEELDEIMNLEN